MEGELVRERKGVSRCGHKRAIGRGSKYDKIHYVHANVIIKPVIMYD